VATVLSLGERRPAEVGGVDRHHMHRVRQVYVFGNDEPNTWVDISGSIEQEIATLKQHASQMED
jgi:hypothetical protein